MDAIAGMIARVLDAPDDASVADAVHRDVKDLCARFPLYPQLATA
jgi:glycine/serine hydroxymethyltransferase